MMQIKLHRLADRTPVKLTVSLSPQLSSSLADYAAFYAAQYGREEPIAELVPAILASFLETDRAFQAARRQGRVSRDD
jgi:hypothetical protein